VIFSNIFLSILHNIGLYIYTVKYKPGIKIPVFLLNISKKKKTKNKKQTNKNIFCFHAYGQVLKNFPSMFLCLKRKKIASFSRFKNPKMDIITSL